MAEDRNLNPKQNEDLSPTGLTETRLPTTKFEIQWKYQNQRYVWLKNLISAK